MVIGCTFVAQYTTVLASYCSETVRGKKSEVKLEEESSGSWSAGEMIDFISHSFIYSTNIYWNAAVLQAHYP